MFLSGVQSVTRLDSRLKHAGMTDFGKEISLTQQAAGNRPTEIEPSAQSNLADWVVGENSSIVALTLQLNSALSYEIEAELSKTKKDKGCWFWCWIKKTRVEVAKNIQANAAAVTPSQNFLIDPSFIIAPSFTRREFADRCDWRPRIRRPHHYRVGDRSKLDPWHRA